MKTTTANSRPTKRILLNVTAIALLIVLVSRSQKSGTLTPHSSHRSYSKVESAVVSTVLSFRKFTQQPLPDRRVVRALEQEEEHENKDDDKQLEAAAFVSARKGSNSS